ncbi:MAG: glycosyltransferase [Granulosicoccus sp.]
MKAPAGDPLVTVGIALYNHERYIVECVESIIHQRYSPVELIILDDGSNDDSLSTLRAFLDKVDTDPDKITINLQTQSNQGMCNTLNTIAKSARGKYISFIGSDDIWMPDKLVDQVDFLEKHPDITLVHSNSVKINAEGEELKKIDYSAKDNSGLLFEALVKRTGGINTPSHLYRRNIYEEIGYYDPDYSFEDTDFWLRLTREHTVGFIDKIHTGYRWHGKNLSKSDNALKFYNEELISIYEKNIQDPQLKRIAIRKIYRKSIVKALKTGSFRQALQYAHRCYQLR